MQVTIVWDVYKTEMMSEAKEKNQVRSEIKCNNKTYKRSKEGNLIIVYHKLQTKSRCSKEEENKKSESTRHIAFPRIERGFHK